LRHIEHNPKVALNLDGDGLGGDIVVFAGEAQAEEDAPPADQVPAYVEKYREGFVRIQMSPQEFAGSYSVPVRVRPTGLRGH
jgi:PPOX class probable F420-dependent enzyme